jgi:hypothetical protein
MSLNLLIQLGIIPALLIALVGMMILRGEDQERSAHRFLLFLLGVGLLILLALFFTVRFSNGNDPQLYFQLAWLSAPSFLGILALTLLNTRAGLAGMDHRARLTTGWLGLAMIILFVLNWNPQFGIEFFILPGALLLALAWALGRRWDWLAIVISLLCLGMLGLFNYSMSHPPDYTAGPPPFPIMILFTLGYNIWPGLTVVISGVLITASLHSSDTHNRLRRMRWFLAGLALALPLSLAYVIFWGSVWDHTSDGLYGIFLSQLSGLIAVGTGMTMMLVLRGRSRLAGMLFMLVLPVMLNQSFEAGWRVSYHEITEARAARIARALDRFQEREGYYPESLDMLTPHDLLFLQQPVILAGKEWCYQGGRDFYRLAAYYREYFSTPVSLRIYASAGEPPTGAWDCEERLAEIKSRYDPPPMAGIPETAPTPIPLPTSAITTQRISVQPLVRARSISVGRWSPDGTYLVFGLPEVSGDQSVMGLSFLKADTGEVCPAGDEKWRTGLDDGLREHFAWLPDGRLLFVSSAGDTMLFRPCETDSVELTASYPVTFTHALAYHEHSGRVLLKNRESFWILDGNSLAAIQIPQVTPNPFEFHWDHFDWSPEGNRLAISRLNGQDASEGSTLFIVNGATGEVQVNWPLDIASDQSAPLVEWLSEDELLLHGSGSLFVIDFRSAPPKFTDVLRDIFLLDISYPDDVSTMAWEGQHLSVRVNHPRNQGIYIYHPETGQVEIIQPHDAIPLFFFPNGEMVEMPKYDAEPSEDKYELIWVDAPDVESQFISVQGHLPRNYPNLFPRYVLDSSQLVFSSSQGVSLVSVPDGEMIGFWELAGGGSYSSYVLPSASQAALVAVAEGDGLYYIALP